MLPRDTLARIIMAKDTVKLISAEGFEFVVDYQAACVSNTIKNMLSSSGKLPGTSAHMLCTIIDDMLCTLRQFHGNGVRGGQIS